MRKKSEIMDQQNAKTEARLQAAQKKLEEEKKNKDKELQNKDKLLEHKEKTIKTMKDKETAIAQDLASKKQQIDYYSGVVQDLAKEQTTAGV